MKRRKFLKNMALGSIGMPFVMNNIQLQTIQQKLFNFAKSAEDRVLIIVRLNGGNDGLNTVIPLDQYDNLVIQRQNILVPQSQALSLNQSNLALHPVMSGMQHIFQDGQLGIIQNVGYPDQNRSHFRSTDIWSTGSLDPYEHKGWLGRHFDDYYPNYPDDYPNATYPDPFAISMGYNVSETCQGLMANFSQAIANPLDSITLPNGTSVDDGTYYGSHMVYLTNLIDQTNAYGQRIYNATMAGNTLSQLYDPNNEVAKQLRFVARMISGGLQTKVYIINIDGFDTHSGQVDQTNILTGRHSTLLKTLSDALYAFQDDINLLGLNQRVAGFTFSEFGRQIASNASLGSDHGDAAPMFLFGECITSQVIGPNPVISNTVVNQAGVPMQIDFRDVYASLLKDWFLVPEEDIEPLFDHSIQYLDLLGSCNLGVEKVSKNKEGLMLYPNPASGMTYLRMNAKNRAYAMHIIDLNGNIVVEVFSNKHLDGEQIIPIDLQNIVTGNYLVVIRDGMMEKSIKLFVIK
ncbi:MAG: DUF1501 domain-containing protein [Crocinitomicaceae bacterium]|nr:DUF1501 domain-containing protein [Crocinitomicaceae bacterium]